MRKWKTLPSELAQQEVRQSPPLLQEIFPFSLEFQTYSNPAENRFPRVENKISFKVNKREKQNKLIRREREKVEENVI